MGLLDQAHSRRVVIKGALKGTTYAAPVVLSTAVPRLVAAVSPPAPTGADLALTKTVDNATPLTLSIILFTVTVSNNGPSAATGVTMTDLPPTGLQFLASAASQGTYSSATGVWTVGSVANGATATLRITAFTTATPGTRTNTAMVSSDQLDPNAANNTASVTVNVL